MGTKYNRFNPKGEQVAPVGAAPPAAQAPPAWSEGGDTICPAAGRN